jgi:hypothetical protein
MHKKSMIVAVILASASGLTPAYATTTISTNAYALLSTVHVSNVAGVNLGPLASASGTASPGYTNSGTAASVNDLTGLGIVSLVSAGLQINTGLLSGYAAANGTLPGDTTSGSANSQVNGLALSLFTKVVVPINTLSIGADTITSQTTVTRTGNTATLAGQSVFTNLNVELLSLLNFSLGANAQIAPNTVLTDVLGLRIVLNEQITGGNGSNILSLATNAMHLFFSDYLLGGRLLSGEVVVAHSYASSYASVNLDSISPAPEPAIWLQLITGFGLTGVLLRRRTRIQNSMQSAA